MFHVTSERISRKHVLRVLFFILLFLLSCSERTGDEPSQDTLVVGHYVSQEIEGLDPISGSLDCSPIVDLVFNGLIQVNDRLEMIPDLADSWEVSADGLVWTFHLRKGVLFHDGMECTAEDVKFTYDLIMNPTVRSPLLLALRQVQEIEPVDRYTIAVSLKEPYTPILTSLNAPVLPKHLLEGTDFPTADFNLHPIGTGPFRLPKWGQAQPLIFEANEKYFKGKPKLSQIVMSLYSEGRTLWVSLMKGEVDIVSYLSPEFFHIVSSDSRFTTHLGNYSFCYMLLYNLRSPLFSERKVRQAIANGIDRNALIEKALLGQGMVATGPFLPRTWPCNPDIAAAPYAPEKALDLLEQAGWKDADGDGFLEKYGHAFEFTLLRDQGDDMKQKAAGVMRLQLEEIGVRMQVEVLPLALMMKRIRSSDFDACFVQINPGLDPDIIWLAWHSEGPYNFSSYRNSQVDEFFDLGRITNSYESRRGIYQKIHALVVGDHPAAFLFYPQPYVVCTSRLKGTTNMSTTDLFYSVEQWYLSN